jgi:hypothetical protein
MAELTAKARSKIPSSEFAGPGRSYPIPDRSHAGNAKGRAAEQYKKGRLSKGAYDRIVARADRKLKE